MDIQQLDKRLQKKAIEFLNVCTANGFDLNVYTMSKDEMQFVCDVMGYYWNQMDGNKAIQDETHRIAEKLRTISGLPLHG